MIESLEDRLRADMTDPDKRNSLLAANINAVVTEECRTNSRLGEVGRLTGGRYLCRPVFFTQYFCANSVYFLRHNSFLQVAAYGRGAASRDRKRKKVTWGDQGGSTAKRSKSSYR